MPDKASTVRRIASRPHWLVGDLGEAAIVASITKTSQWNSA